ncbi:hypothetical protein ACROYT_G015455 [Oculina patagonica]
MNACCSFKSLVGGQCSFDRRDRKQSTEIVPLLSCAKNVAQHKSLFQFHDVESKIELILARAAMFNTPKNVEVMTVCPSNRSSLGLGWTRGTERCRVPQDISLHKMVRGKYPKAERGVNKTSKLILKRTGHLVPVGSGMCRSCREILSSASEEDKLSKLAAKNSPPLVDIDNKEEEVVSQMKELKIGNQYSNRPKSFHEYPIYRGEVKHVFISRYPLLLDYITASGAKAFEELEIVADRLGELGMGMSWAKQRKEQLKLAKRYLKSDFMVRVSESSTVPDHCRCFALSDAKCSKYQGECSHIHDGVCDCCSLVEVCIREIEDALKLIATETEEMDELTFNTEQARRSISAWKAHLLRAVNQDEARVDVMEMLEENSVFLVQDWAMKFPESIEKVKATGLPSEGYLGTSQWHYGSDQTDKSRRWHSCTFFKLATRTVTQCLA